MKNITKNLFLLLVVVFATNSNIFAQQDLTVASSKITFKIKNAGIYVNGSFGGLVATIKFDEKDLKKSSISAIIDANSVNTDNKSRDNHLRKDDYFDVAKYPTIKMETSEIVRSQSGNFIGYFDITMKDKTKKRVVVPFSFKNNVFTGKLTLDRREYGVGGNSMIMGDEVILVLEVMVK